MSLYLLVDLGSTFTKATLVDLDKEEIVATSRSLTTVTDDVTIGFNNALKNLEKVLGHKVTYDKAFACSSAAGGLKMAAIGLVSELTTEAAKRVCLGSGAKVELVYSGILTSDDLATLNENNIDIILLAGGIDSGDKETVITNSKLLSKFDNNIPIVFAGNKVAKDEVKEILTKANKEFYLAENVMPKLNKLNVDSAKNIIQDIFIKKIVVSKGINNLEKYLDGPIIPTPVSVLNAVNLLSQGYGAEKGFADLVLVDVGGATTDVYSAGYGHPKSVNTVLAGLEEPFLKRTVEGDLGMRYSSLGILESLSSYEKAVLNKSFAVEEELTKRFNDVTYLAQNEKDEKVDEFIAYKCTNLAFSRHVGTIKETFTHQGMYYYQIGKDLRDVKYLLGTGGVIINSKNPKNILKGALFDNQKPWELRPSKPKMLVDKKYVLSTLGLLAEIEPEKAIKMLKKEIFA